MSDDRDQMTEVKNIKKIRLHIALPYVTCSMAYAIPTIRINKIDYIL